MAETNLNNTESFEGRIREISKAIDEQTKLWSGGFEHNGGFEEIVNMGEYALPALFDSLADDDLADLWRMQAIWTIASAIGSPITYPETERGHFELIRKATLQWGQVNGYIEVNSANESL